MEMGKGQRRTFHFVVFALAFLIVLSVSLMVAIAVVWLAVAFMALIGFAGLHLVILPGLAARLRVTRSTVSALILPPLVIGGLVFGGGLTGATVGLLVWVIGIAIPSTFHSRSAWQT